MYRFFAFALIVLAVPCWARTISVDNDGPADFNNIQAAIDDANNGDIIEVYDGEYRVDSEIDLRGKSITVKSQNGLYQSIIYNYGSANGFVLNADNDANCTIEGFAMQSDEGSAVKCNRANLLIEECAFGCLRSTIDCNNSRLVVKNSRFDACYNPVICRDSNVTLEQVYVEDCPSSESAFKFERSNLTIVSSSFKNGNSGYEGTLSVVSSNVTIKDSSFIGCQSREGNGGAINCLDSNLYISDSNFLYCRATYRGGGIYCYNSTPTIDNCIIRNNIAGSGAGICSDGYSDVRIHRCVIMNNSAVDSQFGDGGGICVRVQSEATINNCLITGNTAHDWGGGIFCDAGSNASITNCTFNNNTGRNGGAVSFWNSSGQVTNCVLWQDIADLGNEIYLEEESFLTCNYDDIKGGLMETYVEAGSTLNWDSMNIDADPFFVDPYNGDYHLQSAAGRWNPNSKRWVRDSITSPCIDAGDPNSDWTAELWPNGKRINMGAYGGTAEASMSLSAIGKITNLDNDPEEIVNIFDIAIFASQWCLQDMPLSADIDRNGRVDFVDFAILAQTFTAKVNIGIAKNPQPSNGQQSVSPHPALIWSTGTNVISHNVYFGIDFDEVNNADVTNSGVYMGNQDVNYWDTNNYSPAGLNFNTTYYWRIDEVRNTTIVKGNVWCFTVASLEKAGNPQPSDSQQNTPLHSVLSWSVATYASSHDVYFGTSYNDVDIAAQGSGEYMGNQDANYWDTKNYAPTGLNVNTTYYWRIDEVAPTSTTKGDVWSFTTSEPNINYGLAAWWKFDEANGIIAYDSAGSNNGTIYGATWTTGKIAGALSFNGSSNYVNCGSGPSNYDNITVCAWMKTSKNGILVSNRYNSYSYGTWYTLSSTSIELGDNSQGGYKYLTFNTPTLDVAWHHIVYTKDGTNHTIYVDGSLDQSFTSNAVISWVEPLFIGKRWTNNSSINWFNGIIDDVRIYNRALTAEEVTLLYKEAN